MTLTGGRMVGIWRLVLCLVLALPVRAVAAEEQALSDPVLAMGLNGIADWSTQHPFLDKMKSARPWIGHLRGQFGGVGSEELFSGGYLDEQGWPRALPPGVEALETFVLTDQPAAAVGLKGRYILTYEGEGKVEVVGRVTNVRYRTREVRFDYTPDAGLVGIRVSRIDAGQKGDYIRNIRLMREDHLPFAQMGFVFNPDWLRLVRDLRVVRFMDWMGTNNSAQMQWDERPRVNDATYARRGVPVEVMVDLANEIGADPWFTMPHQADDAYMRNFATYVRDHLNPDLKSYVEYSNEVWNWQFEQALWTQDQAATRWGSSEGDAWMQFAGMRAAQMATIWTEVFGAETDRRLVRVIATHTGWPGLEEGLLFAPNWVAENAANPPPVEMFDAYAVTGYFGLPGEAEEVFDRILGWLDAGEDVAARNLLEGIRETGIPALVDESFPYHAGVAARHDLALIMYEGGTHVVGYGAWTENERLTAFLTAFNYSPGMGLLYEELIAGWHAAGGTLFNAFVDVNNPSRWGSWGHLRHLDDVNPRWDVLMEYNATAPVTWEERTPGTFSHGIIRRAAPAGSRVEAQHPRDILLGGDGDDVLVATGCCVRLHGGAGRNVAVLPGETADYAMQWEKNTLHAKTTGGEIRLVNVQQVQFRDGKGESLELIPGVQP